MANSIQCNCFKTMKGFIKSKELKINNLEEKYAYWHVLWMN